MSPENTDCKCSLQTIQFYIKIFTFLVIKVGIYFKVFFKIKKKLFRRKRTRGGLYLLRLKT